jgi:hypothetical protein
MHSTKRIRKGKSNLKNYLFLIFILFLIASCGKNKTAVTHNNLSEDSIIPRSQMVKMLVDVHILEAALKVVKKKGTTDQQMSVFYYQQLFTKYHTSEKRFFANLNYYRAQTEIFYELYGDVVRELEKQVTLRQAVISKRK